VAKAVSLISFVLLVTVVLWTGGARLQVGYDRAAGGRAERGWAGFRDVFISTEGQVIRPRERDTVSEGQAYALLGAVWSGDKLIFDRVLSWTEDNLSRRKVEGDHLLSWRYKDGKVVDLMPASDADVDYALALFLAFRRWKEPRYGELARRVAADALRLYSQETSDGLPYLSPWLLTHREGERVLNPSYLSPAHYRVFAQETGNPRWSTLVDSSYEILSRARRSSPVGLFPDWGVFDAKGDLRPMQGRSFNFGWEAVRIPFRLALDFYWFAEPRAERELTGLAAFVESTSAASGKVFAEYDLFGRCSNCFESPLFYSAYSIALSVLNRPAETWCRAQMDRFVRMWGGSLLYHDSFAYYENALSWFADGLQAGKLDNWEMPLREPAFPQRPRINAISMPL
jgi:endoglucanase